MFRFIIPALFMGIVPEILSGQEVTDLKTKISSVTISSKEDSVAYALALLSYNSWVRENIYPDPVIFAKAMIDSRNGSPLMSEEYARNIIIAFADGLKAKQAEMNLVAYKEYIEVNEAYLAKNSERAGVTVTPSGLQYEVVRMGSGPKPALSGTVEVHYKGTLIDGTEFDSSYKRNSPARFPVSGVIPGWTEALQLMPEGSVFILYIPEKLAYGERGAGAIIKPYSTLIFEVELLKIVKSD